MWKCLAVVAGLILSILILMTVGGCNLLHALL